MKPRIAVAVSGGVDSMVAACLLKQDYSEVFGLHFLTGFEKPAAERSGPDIQSIGSQLGIQVYIVNLSVEFKQNVVDYFCSTYLAGATPNPCMVCNPSIKFGTLLRHAQELGAGYLATGHYAVVRRDEAGRNRLFKGADPNKEQSYFLARLAQSQLDKALFPLGRLTKDTVRDIAVRNGLRPALVDGKPGCVFYSFRRLPGIPSYPKGVPLRTRPDRNARRPNCRRPPGVARFYDRSTPRNQLPGDRTLLCGANRHRPQPLDRRSEEGPAGNGRAA